MKKYTKVVFGDVLFGFVKGRKGEGLYESLRRQGKETRKAKREMFRKATRRVIDEW